jgi:hypothetical protein
MVTSDATVDDEGPADLLKKTFRGPPPKGAAVPAMPAGAVAMVRMDELQKRADRTRVAAAQAVLSAETIDDLTLRFRRMFWSGKRFVTYLVGQELLDRGVPPLFWHDPRSVKAPSSEQQLDLVTFDVLFLADMYARKAWPVRYAQERRGLEDRRYVTQAAVYVFYGGTREVWDMVGRLQVPPEHQLLCAHLHSAAVQRRLMGLKANRDAVFSALNSRTRAARRTATYMDADALATLRRRHHLWFCAELTGWSPSAAARLYGLSTGTSLARTLAYKHIQVILQVLRDHGMTHSRRKKKRSG